MIVHEERPSALHLAGDGAARGTGLAGWSRLSRLFRAFLPCVSFLALIRSFANESYTTRYRQFAANRWSKEALVQVPGRYEGRGGPGVSHSAVRLATKFNNQVVVFNPV